MGQNKLKLDMLTGTGIIELGPGKRPKETGKMNRLLPDQINDYRPTDIAYTLDLMTEYRLYVNHLTAVSICHVTADVDMVYFDNEADMYAEWGRILSNPEIDEEEYA